MKQDLVSIIVPVYNVEAYVAECIESILAQTYSAFELILVNDGSTDGSEAVCRRYDDSRIQLICKANGGLSDARNVGMAAARGQYYLFVDSDDLLHRKTVEVLMREMQQNPADIIVCDKAEIRDEDDMRNFHAYAVEKADGRVMTGEEKFSCLVRGLQDQLTMAQYKLFRRELWEEIRFPVGKIHEDEFTAYRILHRADRVVYLSLPLYGYRIRPQSITQVFELKAQLDKIEAKENIFAFFREEGLSSENSARALFLLLRIIQTAYYKVSIHQRENTAALEQMERKYMHYFSENRALLPYMNRYERSMIKLFARHRGFWHLMENIKARYRAKFS